ncbi:hypothetical protein [Rudaea sp.]|uniref:hypothetical protein n=1 Tax=Rudaea sp. TaxID=2136325 RepID=UPI002ED54DE3
MSNSAIPDIYGTMSVDNKVEGSRNSPSEIAKALDQTFAWFKHYGIDLAKTRFGYYRDLYKKISEAMEASDGARWRALNKREVFATAAEIVNCVEIATLPDSVVGDHVSKLRRYATGERFYSPSTNSSYDQGRDIASELRIAAMFARQRLTVQLEDPADVVVKHNGEVVYIECKRPKTVHGLARCLKRASNQFSTHRHNGHAGIAVVALDMTLVVNPNLEIVAAKNQGDAVETVQKLLADFTRNFERDVLRYQRDFKKDARIEAVMFWGTVVSLTDDRAIDVATATRLQPQGPHGSQAYERCRRFQSLFTMANLHQK